MKGWGKPLDELVHNGITNAREYYLNSKMFEDEVHHFNRVWSNDIENLPRDEIKSGGYTVNTLEASIWCLLNNDGYKDTLLEAVNLGGDTDTTGCVCGGLAGLYYGLDSIPFEWLECLVRKSYLEMLMDNFLMEVEQVMVDLMEYELKQSLLNVKSARRLIDKKRELYDSDMLENYHIELLDLEFRLEDMVKNIDKVEDYF